MNEQTRRAFLGALAGVVAAYAATTGVDSEVLADMGAEFLSELEEESSSSSIASSCSCMGCWLRCGDGLSSHRVSLERAKEIESGYVAAPKNKRDEIIAALRQECGR